MSIVSIALLIYLAGFVGTYICSARMGGYADDSFTVSIIWFIAVPLLILLKIGESLEEIHNWIQDL